MIGLSGGGPESATTVRLKKLGVSSAQILEALGANPTSTFRLGAEDAKYLAWEFYPAFGEEDFLNLPPYHVYLRLMIDGVMSKPFSARTYRLGFPRPN